MTQATPGKSFTADEYLAWERAQVERHEYVAGDVSTKAGADDQHNTVAGNVAVALRQHLAGSPCRTFMSDMRLQVAAADAYFYPDVFVTCANADRGNTDVKAEALLVVEVLSESTAAYDRGAKFAHYRRLPSLRELALIDPATRTADVFRLRDDGLWELHPFSREDGIALASVDLALDGARLYADVIDT